MDLLSLTLFLAAGALLWNWWADRQAADRATLIARRACEQAGVVWLDQNAQRVGKRLARGEDGRLVWRRDFDFEFTSTGEERQLGRVSLLGHRVVALVGPAPAPTVYVGR
jgi:hypothetical protein